MMHHPPRIVVIILVKYHQWKMMKLNLLLKVLHLIKINNQ